jgi:hypothetical protein
MPLLFTSPHRGEVGTISAVTRVFAALWCRVRGPSDYIATVRPHPTLSPRERGLAAFDDVFPSKRETL